MSKLYELTGAYQNLLEVSEDIPVEVLKEGLEQIEGDIEDKVNNMVRLIRNEESDIDALKVEEKRLADRRKAKENRVKAVKEYMEHNLKSLNKDKIKTPYFTVAIQKNAPSVVVEDESVIDDKYFITERKLDKKAIGELLKKGEEVKGVTLKQSESLRIR